MNTVAIHRWPTSQTVQRSTAPREGLARSRRAESARTFCTDRVNRRLSVIDELGTRSHACMERSCASPTGGPPSSAPCSRRSRTSTPPSAASTPPPPAAADVPRVLLQAPRPWCARHDAHLARARRGARKGPPQGQPVRPPCPDFAAILACLETNPRIRARMASYAITRTTSPTSTTQLDHARPQQLPPDPPG